MILPIEKNPNDDRVYSNQDVICNNCGFSGHIDRGCRYSGKTVNTSAGVSNSNIVNNNSNISAYSTGVSFSAASVNCTGDKTTVCIDSGTSSHLPSKELFTSLDQSKRGTVTTANGQTSPVMGVEEAVVSNASGKLHLKDARFTPDSNSALVLVSQLTDDGFSVVFDQQKATVTQQTIDLAPEDIHFEVPRQGDLYQTSAEGSSVADQSCAAREPADMHAAWGHLGEKATVELKKAYPELKIKHPGVCETCIKGKQCQSSYPLTHNYSYQPLEFIFNG
ncbi:hypothetical protein TYRP_019277 [Tyrophagus putrescentiae]|nr:hypothetical protein TYRP_019277 [Tyrophagus putrescentiae]